MFKVTILICLAATAALAQTHGVPPIVSAPADASGWISLLIIGLTPTIIAAVKWFTPKMPSVAWPFVAPVVGVILTQAEVWATGHPTSLVLGAALGGLGLWAREAVDQVRKLNTPVKPNGNGYLNK